MLKGSIVALVTPFYLNGEVNYPKIEELVEFHINYGTDALLILGTTAESPTLTDEEKDKIVKCVIAKNNKRLQIVIGVTSNCTSEAITKAKKYESMGADYLLAISPYYNKTNKQGLIKHFKLIANCVKIPIILYNIPSRTGINIDIDVMLELKKISNIIGVKETNKDANYLMDLMSICDDEFSLYCGNDELIFLFLSLGARGLINVYGNLEPPLIKDIFNLYNSNIQKSKELFFKYYEIFKMIFIETNPIPIKALMNYKGMNVGRYRLPLYDISSDNYQKLLIAFNNI